MVSRKFSVVAAVAVVGLTLLGGVQAHAQDEEKHGRKYKAPPVTSHLEVLVLKDSTGKPIPNASVIFHPLMDGENAGNMETKTGPDGKAIIEVIPTGSVVALQVIADGFATHGSRFSLTEPSKTITVRMVKPQAQVSAYEDAKTGLDRGAGVREPDRKPVESKAKTLAAGEPVIKLAGTSASGGTISGRLTTPSGAPIAFAKVRIEKTSDQNAVLNVKTTDDGRYAAVGLVAGTYRIHMECPGYVAHDHGDLELKPGGSLVVDGTLPFKK